MTDQEARYDRIAEAYAAHWSPVHRPSTLALLDEVEADVAAPEGVTIVADPSEVVARVLPPRVEEVEPVAVAEEGEEAEEGEGAEAGESGESSGTAAGDAEG